MTLDTICLRSGGQTGVDRAALDFAIAKQIQYSGWCPKGGLAEDMPDPRGLIERYPSLTETPSPVPEQRTAWNVRDSDKTFILTFGPAVEGFPGTAFTRLCCELIFLKPFLIVDLTTHPDPAAAADWLSAAVGGNEPLCLNIAGPRESEAPGIYAASLRFLDALWQQAIEKSFDSRPPRR